MERLLYIIAAISVMMVIIAGSGTLLISRTIVAQSKVDAVSSTAKGVALALSEQINLLNNMLDKMAQDPDVVLAVAQKNPELLAAAAKKLESHLPGVLSIKFLLADEKDPNKPITTDMSFADVVMARKTFEENQPTAIQGDINVDRHLAIARRVMQNNTAIGVILAGVNYDFISRILSATPLEKGYIELKQGKLVLASTGTKIGKEEIYTPPIPVPNTDWELFFENTGVTGVIEFSLIIGIILIPVLIVALAFTMGYRKISDALSEDVAWIIKAFKDIVTEKPLGEYPIKFPEMKTVITTLSQFKRIVNDKWFEI
jgi:phosphomannomutase / phosphoglucomutase